MSKTIDFYYSCTKDRLITDFRNDGTYVAFLANGKRLFDGVYVKKIIEGCEFYFLDNSFVLAVNNLTNVVVLLQQYEKYTYVFSTQLFNKKTIKSKKERQVSFCVTDLNKNCKSNLNLEQLTLVNKDVEVIFLDYHKQNKFKSFYYPIEFIKKLSGLNFLISQSKNEVVSVLDIQNSIDLKFLIETHSLEDNTILVPNIIHYNDEVLPISFLKSNSIFFNENDSQNKFILNLIINSLIKGMFIKTYPVIVNNIRIRGNFDNISEEDQNLLLSSFKENYIFKPDDFKSYKAPSPLSTSIEFK